MSQNKIAKNIFYNTAYQVLGILVPLLTSPYIARVLGAKQIGIASSTNAVTLYFVIFGMLGISNYGNRTIASTRSKGENVSKVFWSIYTWQLFLSMIMGMCFLFYAYYYGGEFQLVLLLQGLLLVANALDVTWFFYGIEDFKTVVIRNAVIKLAGLISIFAFVRSTEDLWKYVLINSGITLLGQLCMWPYVVRKIYFVRPNFKEMLHHISPIIVLFIPVLAISIFTSVNKVMISQMSGFIENGYYENADKIISIPKALIQSLGAVMLPRTAALIASGNKQKSESYIELTMLYMSIISSALMFGLMGVSERFSVLFWGEEFIVSGRLISIMAPAFVISVFGNVIRTQFLIPRSRDKEYTISLILGAIASITINYIFIPKYGATGAALGAVVTELVMTVAQTFFVQSELDIVKYLKNGGVFFIFGALMWLVLRILDALLPINFIAFVVMVAVGALIYCVCLYVYLKMFRTPVTVELLNRLQLLKVKKPSS